MIATTIRRGVRRAAYGLCAGAALSVCATLPTPVAHAQAIGTPDVVGDQLVFLYDARTDRVAFLSVANSSDDTIFLDVALYNADLTEELAGQVISLAGAANAVIDPTGFGGGGANGNAGLAVVTPVRSEQDLTPVVPPQPIVGGFTLANVSLRSGFGQNPFARFAVNSSGVPQAPGTIVDGATVVYERFDPGILTIPAYFDPATLAPPENDGNRVLLAAFADDYDGAYGLSPVSTTASVTFLNNDGVRIVDQNPVAVNGVLLSNLQSISGGANIDGASGKVFFEVNANGGNVFGLFSQSLDTFAAGQRMPMANEVPTGTGQVQPPPGPTPEPTPPPPSGDCTPTVSLVFDDSAVPDLSGVVVIVSYPSTAEIPGTAGDPPVVGAITDLTGTGGLLTASDQDTDPNNASVSIGVVAIPGPINPGPYASIAFAGSCTVQDLSCSVQQASILLGNEVTSQVDCSISLG